MKKIVYLFACIVINFALLSGCSTINNEAAAIETEPSITESTSTQRIDTNGWKSTPYEVVNNFDDVNINVIKETVSSTELTVSLENNSNCHCIFGESFWLEKKINERWYQVPVAIDGNYPFNDIGYDLDSGDDTEWSVDWNWLYGSLDTGDYRIIKDIVDLKGSDVFDTYFLAAEFTIY